MTDHERRELDPPALTLSRGSLGPDVKRLQEWLTLHGFGTAIDGDFGPATEASLRAYQRDEWMGPVPWPEGVVNADVWASLVRQLARVADYKRQDWPKQTDGEAISVIARAHLAARPREVGGPNSGPWVRGLYMDGHEGKDWPWCAGFATYVLRQALGHDKWRTFSCDELAATALGDGRLLMGMSHDTAKRIRPGSIFLVRRPDRRWAHDWIHCGIVTAIGPEHFEAIEGNTNQGGSREGTEVCRRVRAFNARTDFILLGGET
jgi:hypothetical protein